MLIYPRQIFKIRLVYLTLYLLNEARAPHFFISETSTALHLTTGDDSLELIGGDKNLWTGSKG